MNDLVASLRTHPFYTDQLVDHRTLSAREASTTTVEIESRLDAALDDIATTLHAHPTFPETLVEAAEAAKEEAIHAY